MVSNLNDLKRRIFHDMLTLAGRVFIVVRFSEEVIIGHRGFTPEEKEQGLVLVFNRMMQFEWNETGLHASLGFGSKVEKCYVPPDNIIAVFSPELTAQFVTSPEKKEIATIPEMPVSVKTAKPSAEEPPGKNTPRSGQGEKVVKVDFSKKK